MGEGLVKRAVMVLGKLLGVTHKLSIRQTDDDSDEPVGTAASRAAPSGAAPRLRKTPAYTAAMCLLENK